MELLRRERTALISHAVTKGLDPDVPRYGLRFGMAGLLCLLTGRRCKLGRIVTSQGGMTPDMRQRQYAVRRLDSVGFAKRI